LYEHDEEMCIAGIANGKVKVLHLNSAASCTCYLIGAVRHRQCRRSA